MRVIWVGKVVAALHVERVTEDTWLGMGTEKRASRELALTGGLNSSVL